MTYKELKVEQATNEVKISNLQKYDVKQKKTIKGMSSRVKDLSDLLKKDKRASNTIIDKTLRNACSTIEQAESKKKTGKALHKEALRFKEDSIIDSATSIKQINKLKKVLFCFDMLYGK